MHDVFESSNRFIVCFDCCVCLIAIPRMSSWAYAPREDLAAWNSKRVLSSSPAPSPPIFLETLPISDRALSVAALKWSHSLPLLTLLPPTPYLSLCSPAPRFSKWGSRSCRYGRTFSVLFSSAFLSSPFFSPHFLEVVFGLGAVKGKEKGPVFLSRWKQPWKRQVHGPQAAACASQAEAFYFPLLSQEHFI